MCPDGSSVGRTGPKCEFTVCPGRINEVTFVCDAGKSIAAKFYLDQDDHVDLKLSDNRELALPHAISASGARYASRDESIVFWNKGETAFITENSSTTYANCEIKKVNDGWKIYSDKNGRVTFKYPEKLTTKYISVVDWPPKAKFLNQAYSCKEAGSEITQAGRTEKLMVDNREYCLTKESEGAAGSTYTNYTYGFSKNGGTALLTFSLRSVQCGNYYGMPEQTECEGERQTFDIDSVVDKMAQSLEIK